MADKYIVDALQHALENISGKTFLADSYGNIVDMLNAFNKNYECIVTFTTEPTTATIVVKNTSGNVIAANDDGTYTLKSGSYKYDVSADGYESKENVTLTISSSDITAGTKTVSVTLTQIPAQSDLNT